MEDLAEFRPPRRMTPVLQRFAEDKKLLEQRSKELTESRRAVEEKVEEIRQQIEETKLSAVNPVLVTSQVFILISA